VSSSGRQARYPQCEEVRQEAHRVVELLVERARVLTHCPLDVLGCLANLQGIQTEGPTDGDTFRTECFRDACPVVEWFEDDADAVLALLDRADEVLFRAERFPQTQYRRR